MASHNVSIRPAVPTDHGSLCLLFDELDAFHRTGDPQLLRQPLVDPRPQAYLDGLIEDPRSEIFVADVGGDCVGVAIVQLQDAPTFPVFIEQTWAVVDNIAVRSDARRRGVGRALYSACLRWSEEVGACWLELTVYEFNESARRFYESLGFATIRRRMRRSLTPPPPTDPT